MTARCFLPCILFLVTAGTAFAVPGPSASLRVSELTAVPGKTLPPGGYTVQVLDHLTDRYILQIDNADESTHTLFIGIQSKSLTSAAPGVIKWPAAAAGANYIRGWKFPGLPTIEFVYPKNDAVAVAKANGTDVPAIDPESDNITSARLSQDEQKIVTLWLLTPTAVSPSAPAGISAQKLSQVAVVHKPAKLPKTGSELPLVALLGTLSMAGACAFRFAATRRA